MTIWVDADSCPKAVREIIMRAANRRKVAAIFVADRILPLQKSKYVSDIIVESDTNSADSRIVSEAEIGDLAVTRDVPLASELVKKGVTAVNDRGTVYSANNIGERLSMRNFMYDLRESGIQVERHRPATPKDIASFSNSFDRELTRLLKNRAIVSEK
ncbi:MAG: YaiI/YqxD family protein [Spirochaetales bacterium]|nr:YaiI/YqxD family protein [Spirochaetales bacterium]